MKEVIEELFDINDVRRMLNNEYMEETEQQKLIIKSIITKVREMLRKGIPVRITDEMRRLKIDDRVNEMLWKHEMDRRLSLLSHDEDDEDEPEAIEFGFK